MVVYTVLDTPQKFMQELATEAMEVLGGGTEISCTTASVAMPLGVEIDVPKVFEEESPRAVVR